MFSTLRDAGVSNVPQAVVNGGTCCAVALQAWVPDALPLLLLLLLLPVLLLLLPLLLSA
jgi:hypothetical protein